MFGDNIIMMLEGVLVECVYRMKGAQMLTTVNNMAVTDNPRDGDNAISSLPSTDCIDG